MSESVAKEAKANGTISCHISGACANQSCASCKSGACANQSCASCKPCIRTVTFTPDSDHSIKHGQHQYVAFVPEGDELGLVKKLCNGRIDLTNELCCPNLLSQVALHAKKVTVVVSQPRYGKVGPKLKKLIFPAEPAK